MGNMLKTFFFIALVLIILLAALQYWLRNVWFYRDPVRRPPNPTGKILSPADGIVIYLRPFRDGTVDSEKLGERIPITELSKVPRGAGGDGWIIGVYMSPLDVHFNYAPVSGQAEAIIHTQAKVNLPMVDLWEYVKLTYLRRAVDLFSHRFRLINERNTIILTGEAPTIAMVEIADKFVNKITCFVETGQEVQAGQKVSFIERGSQVDLIIFDPQVRFLVKTGDRVIGAQTVLAEYGKAK